MKNVDLEKVQEEERKMRIEDLRKEIEALDNQVFRLLEKRLKVSLQIGKLKTKNGEEVYDPNRETEVIRNVVENDYDLPDGFVSEMMKLILENMRKISQKRNE